MSDVHWLASQAEKPIFVLQLIEVPPNAETIILMDPVEGEFVVEIDVMKSQANWFVHMHPVGTPKDSAVSALV